MHLLLQRNLHLKQDVCSLRYLGMRCDVQSSEYCSFSQLHSFDNLVTSYYAVLV